jgi:sec-independent protein translocase protein TatB
VFGLSFGELMVLLIVAMVVLGPKELPKYLRKAGQFAVRMRRLAYEMREKSGIDEVLRSEGIDMDIAEIRRLARGELTGVVQAVKSTADLARVNPLAPKRPALPAVPGTAAAATASAAVAAVAAAAEVPAPGAATAVASAVAAAAGEAAAADVPASPYARTQVPPTSPVEIEREREYPREGADGYSALPDTAIVYDGSLPASPLGDDALYTRGEAA